MCGKGVDFRSGADMLRLDGGCSNSFLGNKIRYFTDSSFSSCLVCWGLPSARVRFFSLCFYGVSMPKRKRGKARVFTFEDLLEKLSECDMTPEIRFTAIVANSLVGRGCFSFDELSRLTGTKTKILQSYHFRTLNDYGFLEQSDDGKFKVVMPESRKSTTKLRYNSKKLDLKEFSNKLISEYKKIWVDRYHKKCVVNGIERTKASKLIGELGFDEVLRRLKNFMSHEDPWIVERCHAFIIFYKLVNQYTYSRGSNGRKKEKTAIIRHGSKDFEEEVRRFEERELSESDR